jgi:hypothetical protein
MTTVLKAKIRTLAGFPTRAILLFDILTLPRDLEGFSGVIDSPTQPSGISSRRKAS